jgi:hypothetical protein
MVIEPYAIPPTVKRNSRTTSDAERVGGGGWLKNMSDETVHSVFWAKPSDWLRPTSAGAAMCPAAAKTT